MTEKGPNEQVATALLDAIQPVIERFGNSGDSELLLQIAPSLVIFGATLMIRQQGKDFTSKALKDIAENIEQGAFDTAGS